MIFNVFFSIQEVSLDSILQVTLEWNGTKQRDNILLFEGAVQAKSLSSAQQKNYIGKDSARDAIDM